MLRRLASLGLIAVLVGCFSNSSGPSGLPYSVNATAFPYHYQVEAARIVQERDADPGFTRVSRPATTSGETLLAPKRWFSCIRGIPAPAPPSGVLAALAQFFRTWFAAEEPSGVVYDIVLFFSGDRKVALQEGYDLPLCRNLEFEFIMAEPPPV